MPRWLPRIIIATLAILIGLSLVAYSGYAYGYHKAYVDKDRVLNAIADATGITPNPFDPPQQ